jgi:hypothetical protein
MNASGPIQIDWRTAEVSHGDTLTVALRGELPRGWRKRFAGVVGLLDPDSGRWGDVALRKGKIVVAGVREGAEADLRHLLESALMQVNSDLNSGHEDDDADEDDPVGEAETRMSDRFRGFASTSTGNA